MKILEDQKIADHFGAEVIDSNGCLDIEQSLYCLITDAEKLVLEYIGIPNVASWVNFGNEIMDLCLMQIDFMRKGELGLNEQVKTGLYKFLK